MKNYFEYKGYIGTVEMSIEDNVFFGTIHGIDDLVTFEADNFPDLKRAFQEAVDDYLEYCKECGKEPDKEYKGQFNVRIPPELHRDLAKEALKKHISLNQLVERACYFYVEKCENEKTNLEQYFSNYEYVTYHQFFKNNYYLLKSLSYLYTGGSNERVDYMSK